MYDGDCGFCTSSARWLERRTDAEVVAWQHLDLAEAGLTEAEVTTAAYWLEGSEKRRGARAIAQALQSCRGPWPVVGRLIDLPPVRPLARLGYEVVARNRHRLPGGTPACRL